MSKQTLPTRESLSPKDTWDLTTIFKTDADFEKALTQAQDQVVNLAALKNQLHQGSLVFGDVLQAIFTQYQALEKIYVYASMKNDQDTTVDQYQKYQAQVDNLAAQISAATAFLEPEILAIPKETLTEWLKTPELKIYQHFIETITNNRQHILDASQESLIAAAGDIFSAAGQTFSVLDNSDLTFGTVTTEDGQKVTLSNGLYSQLLQSTDVNIRQEAFETLYRAYGQFKNTFASTLATEIKTHHYLATTHHYTSARQAALSPKNIPEAVYETLVAQVNEHLPLLHRYVKLRKETLGVKQLHAYDLYTPLLGKAPLSYTYETAKKTALSALSILGPDYQKILQHLFDDRVIDVIENKGKRSGAYSGGSYDTEPFILLNWQDDLENLYTLVHEAGHSVHSYLTRKNQPYIYGDYPIFLAEIASTTNENLLTEYLLATETDPKVRAYLLNHYLDGFKGTVFRQTQFAEFEHHIHQQVAQNLPLTAQGMSDYYANLNARYYGPDLTRDPQIALEWSRIPHFYMNYYVYQYATGFAAATALTKKITTKQPDALKDYLDFLKSGSTDFPLNIIQKAGVDMTKSDYLKAAFDVFETRLDELETLIK